MTRVGEWAALGRAITSRRVELGYDRRDDFATAAGIGSRTIGELERGEEKGYRDSLIAKLEKALQWPPGAVRSIVDGGDPPEPGARVLYGDPDQPSPFEHPAVAELAEILAPDSPLSNATRNRLTAALSALFEAARHDFRGAGSTVDWSTGRALDAFLNPDTAMDERDRQAISDGMKALLRLGETAMMHWTAAHGPSDEELVARSRRTAVDATVRERHDAGR